MTRARDVADTQENNGGGVAPFVAGKNKVINGDFGISQRGTSFTYGASGYTLDRWTYAVASAIPSGSISQQTFTAGSAPVAGYEAPYFFRSNVTAANGCTNVTLENRIEDVRTFAGQTITLSCWVKTDAATSFNVIFQQNFGSGGSGAVNTNAIVSQATTSGWVRYSGTVTLPSIAGKTIGAGNYLSVYFVLPNNGSNIRVGNFDLWGVQVESGNVATPFTTATGTIQGELAACQRYYYRTAGINNGIIGIGQAISTTVVILQIPFLVNMRVRPTAVDSSSLYVADGVSAFVGGTITIGSVLNGLGVVNYNWVGLTQYRPYYLSMTSDSGYVGFNAEL